ncbi:45294_t:CDS:10, partial [Gigaspora margarita]
MVRWYEKCINQVPEKRKWIGNPQDGCLVREIDPELEVLMLHENLQAISLTEDALPSTAGYYHYQPKNGKEDWIPLLSGYSVFFQMAKTRINPSTKRSLPQYLGFLDNDNINYLKAAVAMHYPNLYQTNQLLKINTLIDTESKKENPSTIIQCDIILERGGKNLPPESIQALIFDHKEKKVNIRNLRRQISRLKERVDQLENELEQGFESDNLDEDNLLETSIDKTIEFNQLGSTILVSTKNYLSLVLTQSCPNCNNSNLHNKSWNLSSIGFQVKCIIECKKCNDIYEHTNEKEIRFAKAAAAAGLARGISHNALQSSLAAIGITSQLGKKMYNNYQKLYFSPLIASAKSSTAQALQKCIEYTINQNKKALTIEFDCSWAHVRNANQASGEFICQEMPPEYSHKPIVTFHVVQKSRSIKDNKTELTKTIHQGNFDKSSRQIEHAILIEVLNQISPLLEENDLHLDVCVDSNLDSNKTLAHVRIVTKISADLKHLTKNIRNSVLNKNFKSFEDHIMRWFRGCIYSAELKRESKDQSAPSKAETCKMQVDGLIRHLQNDHSNCWSDICWTKEDPTILIQNPTLCHSSEKIYSGQCFELEDTINIGMIEFERSEQNKTNVNKIHQCNKLRSEKFANERTELIGFDFSKELVYYKDKAQERIRNDEFYLSFASLIVDFDVTVRYLRPGQIDAINYYIGENKDTLVIMKTDGGKSFCYVASSILFDGLTIIISPLKSLIQNQVDHFIQLGILCGCLLASSQRTVEYEKKVCKEIALGFTRLLFVTPEKLLLNKSLRILCKRLHDNEKLQEEWGNLGKLKEWYPNSRIMALTATLSSKDIKNLQNNLNIDDKKFALVRNGNLLRPELSFSVLDRKDINLVWIDQIMSLVKDIEETGHAIIYCARVKDCTEIREALNLRVEKGTLGIYYGQLTENEKKDTIKRWNKKQICIMIATSAFGLGIDMPDVRLVINYNFLMSMTDLIQNSGRAGRNRKPGAKCVILYTRKDIRTNYAIIADNRMSNEDDEDNYDNNEQTAIRRLYLNKAEFQLFEVMYYCRTFYECRFQQISRYYLLPDDPIPPECGSCDNCLNRADDSASLQDAKIDILDMLNVISLLCDNNNKIVPSDVVDPTVLNTKPLAELALADLVRRGFVKQTILLNKKANTAHLTCTIVIEGTTENVNQLLQTNNWSYW